MKDKREFQIAMVLTGLVGVNFVYLVVIFFSGLYDALFRWTADTQLAWLPAVLVLVANLVTIVGLFYLVRPREEG